MNQTDEQYLATLNRLLQFGVRKESRAGTTRSLFGHQMKFDLTQGFPLLTTKKLHAKSIIVELLWFLRGGTNTDYLHRHGVTIWDEWADEHGNLGPVYGKQWRSWPTIADNSYSANEDNTRPSLVEGTPIDQIANLLNGLKDNPFGRRHIVTAWNPAEVDDMALPPCHCLFQFNVRPGDPVGVGPRYLDCHLYQRSADWFLGVPFNIASYALLTQLVAREVGLHPGEFIHSFGDYHLYETHIEQATEQLRRTPRELPAMYVENDWKGIFELDYDDFNLAGYDPWPAIKAEVSV